MLWTRMSASDCKAILAEHIQVPMPPNNGLQSDAPQAARA